MKDRLSPSSSRKQYRFFVEDLSFGSNGPYSFGCLAGECIGITGDSGVGKTLLLRALADLDIHSGTVALDNRACGDYPPPEWRARVALVPAEPRWWYEEVSAHLGDNYDQQEARSLVESCGFGSDVLNWQVSRLSTGEKQRLAVVRALTRRPDVLLLDETGSGLDQNNAQLLEGVIRAYQVQNRAPVLWVSHAEEQLARVADRRLSLYRGHLELPEPTGSTEGQP